MIPASPATDSRRPRNPPAAAALADRAVPRPGFSLVELLVVLAIIGTVTGMLLPAVQRSREAARRTACGNGIRQTALGVVSYEAARRTFPAGWDAVPREPDAPHGTQHAWSATILPLVGEGPLAARIDPTRVWDAAGGNDVASDQSVATYVCPSGIVFSPGKSDYGGVSGSWIIAEGVPFAGPAGFHNGMLFAVDGDHRPARAASVTDGLGRTLLVAEAVDRGTADAAPGDPAAAGRWARINCFAQAATFVNTRGSDIASNHPGGANGAFADGRVAFLGDSMDPVVLSAICTRNGGEAEASSSGGP